MQWRTRAPGQTTPAPQPQVNPGADPGDPNAAYVFQPAPAADDGKGVVTLDQLYHLSRLL